MSFLFAGDLGEAELRVRLAGNPDSRSLLLALADLVPDTEAEGCLRAVLALHPEEPEALLGLAAILERRGVLPEAVDLAQRRLRGAPDDIAAHRLLGRTWSRLFDRGRAGQHWGRCLDLAPDDPEALAGLAALESLPEGLPEDFVRCLFDGFAERYDDHMVRRLRYRGPDRLKELLEATGPLEPAGLDILDLGCGTGLAGEVLKPHAHRLEGIDLSPAMVEKARERGVYDALAVADMVTALSRPGTAWDLIVAADALVYVGDLGPVLAAAAGALRPGGRFAGTVEESSGPDLELKPTKRFGHSRGHIERTAAAAGLAVAAIQAISYREEKTIPVPSLAFVLDQRMR